MRSIVFSIHQDVGFFYLSFIYVSYSFVSHWPIIFFILLILLCHELKWPRGQGNTRNILMIPLYPYQNLQDLISWCHLPLLHHVFLEIISSTMNRTPQSFRLAWVRWLLTEMLWMTLMDYGVNLYARIEASQKHLMKLSCLYTVPEKTTEIPIDVIHTTTQICPQTVIQVMMLKFQLRLLWRNWELWHWWPFTGLPWWKWN